MILSFAYKNLCWASQLPAAFYFFIFFLTTVGINVITGAFLVLKS
jgi:hypothetical protein